MIVTIEGRMNVSGQWWDVSFEFPLPADKSRDGKMKLLNDTIASLSTSGVISRVALPPGQNSKPTVSDARPNGDPPMLQQAAMDLTPVCPVHREKMSTSQVQKEDQFINYFCPKRGDDGYCRHRAKAARDTGAPSFWEVKK